MKTCRCAHCKKEKDINCFSPAGVRCRMCERERNNKRRRTRYNGDVRTNYVSHHERMTK